MLGNSWLQKQWFDNLILVFDWLHIASISALFPNTCKPCQKPLMKAWFTLYQHDSVGCMEDLKPGDSGLSLEKNLKSIIIEL